MYISPVKNNTKSNNSKSFGSLNLIQVRKIAFPSTTSLEGIERTFDTKLDDITHKIIVRRLPFNLTINQRRPANIYSDLESAPFIEAMKAKGEYSLSWLRQNFRVDVPEPLDSNCHSFYVYTRENSDYRYELTRGKTSREINREVDIAAEERYQNRKATSWAESKETEKERDAFTIVKQLEILQRRLTAFNKETQNGHVNKFLIDDLAQLPDVMAKIDY